MQIYSQERAWELQSFDESGPVWNIRIPQGQQQINEGIDEAIAVRTLPQ
jgi:hypothetical protein